MSTGSIRLLQHAAAGAIVLACLLVVPRPSAPMAIEELPVDAPLEEAVESPGPTPTPASLSDRPTPVARTSFGPAVERWRPLAVNAAGQVAETEGVALNPELLLALVAVESSGDERAISPAGAVGLTQLQPATFGDMVARHPRLFPTRDPSDPAENVLAGGLYLVWCARYLSSTPAAVNDWRPALNAYNLGPSAAREIERSGAGVGILPPETVAHEQRILSLYGLATSSIQ